MKRTVRTSEMFRCRLESVEKRLRIVRMAIRDRDFGAMAGTIMQESDSMHASMLDSWPPITYLNSASLEIMHRTIELNHSYGRPVAAYTFDAGPNAHVYTSAGRVSEVKGMLLSIEGVRRVLICGVGSGIRILSRHLF